MTLLSPGNAPGRALAGFSKLVPGFPSPGLIGFVFTISLSLSPFKVPGLLTGLVFDPSELGGLGAGLIGCDFGKSPLEGRMRPPPVLGFVGFFGLGFGDGKGRGFGDALLVGFGGGSR